MIAVDERIKSIEHLDFEAPCAWVGFEETASHFAVCRGCCDTNLICDGHIRRLKALDVRGWHIRCSRCPKRGRFVEVVDLRPLP